MKSNHKAALQFAMHEKVVVINDHISNLAEAYLDLREKAKASLDAKDKSLQLVRTEFYDSALDEEDKADAALRECLGERK